MLFRSSPIPRVIRHPTEPRIVTRVIRRTQEPPMPVPVPCVNHFDALSEESLYDSQLDLGLSVEALAAAPVSRARRHCISSAGIGRTSTHKQSLFLRIVLLLFRPASGPK